MSLDTDDIYVVTAERIFADLADIQTVAHAADDGWKPALWKALEENGLTLALTPEEAGGPGLALDEAMALLRAAGRFALAVPLAEAMLGNRMLGLAGLEPVDGVVVPLFSTTAAPVIDAGGIVSGTLRRVPFARDAARFAVLCDGPSGPVVALVDPAGCALRHGTSLAFEPSDDVTLGGTALAQAPAGEGAGDLLNLAATVRAQQIAGALERVLEITVGYAMEREAFTKKIAKFQAVQHLLAQLGEETAAAVAAACSAADTLARGDSGLPALLEVGAAKIRCGEAAQKASAIAHEVHGAIGYTAEHPLHRLTLRAQAWRDDHGTEAHWAVALGRAIAADGAVALWPLMASR